MEGELPLWNGTEAEWRRHRARVFYDLEMAFREDSWPNPALVYNEEHDLFRFEDGVFAFSCEHAIWVELKRRGYC